MASGYRIGTSGVESRIGQDFALKTSSTMGFFNMDGSTLGLKPYHFYRTRHDVSAQQHFCDIAEKTYLSKDSHAAAF